MNCAGFLDDDELVTALWARTRFFTHAAALSVADAEQVVAVGEERVVASHFPLGAYAAREVLRLGGNLIDAMVASVAIDCVVSPGASTLAGGLGMLFFDAASGQTHVLDAGLDVPSAFELPGGDAWRALSETGAAVLVPGVLPGLEDAWLRFGTLPWDVLWEPARRLAADGFPMYFTYSFNLARRGDTILARPEGRAIFAPGGELVEQGATFRQPALAETIDAIIAERSRALTGTSGWARRFATAVAAAGGTLSVEDLHHYTTRWGDPISGTFLDHEIIVSPLPSFYGSQLLVALGLCEAANISDLPTDSADALLLEIRAVDAAEAVVPVFDPSNATPEQLDEYQRVLTAARSGELAHAFGLHSTQRPHLGSHDFCAIDAEGNAVVAMHSIGSDSWGPAIFVDGIVANGAAAQLLDHPARPRARLPGGGTMCLVRHDDKIVLATDALGTGIVECHLQTLVDVIGRGLDLADADRQPRFGARELDPATGDTTTTRQVEPGFPAERLDIIAAAIGYPLHEVPRAGQGFWTVARRTTEDALQGMCDHRLLGTAFVD
ncbi:MAG: gamma-glutamyltransferase [Acidimicrobiia bacterium]